MSNFTSAYSGRLLHKLTMGLWFLSWLGRDGRVEKRSGCVWTSLSVCAKMKLEQQTHRHDMTEVSGIHATQSGLNAGVRFPSAATTWNFPHRRIPQSHCCHCLPVNSQSTPRKTKSGRAALMMRHAEVVLALVAGWPFALWLYAVLTAARKWKQQVVEWNGLNSHDIYTICLLMRTGWKRPWFLCQIEPVKTFGGFEFIAFPYCSVPPCFSLEGKRWVLRDRCGCLRY